jgi:UDP-N-acetylmuramate dehydrogenase
MTQLDREWLVARYGARVQFEAAYGDYTSFRIGGPVEALVIAKIQVDLIDAIAWAEVSNVPWLVLGRGSNVLIDDAGVRGVVIRNETSSTSIDTESGVVRCDSGVRLPSLGAQSAKVGLRGLEFAVGIPGSVGGGAVMNAGAHGGSIADVLVSADVLVAGSREAWGPDRLEHAYRSSALQRRRDAVVLSATFKLARGESAVALAQVKEYRVHRQETQPWDPGAGSIFRNPPESSAGALIDRAGLKGTRRGGAIISPKHANFIVNVDGARSADVLALIDLARLTVLREHGILLHPEVELIGPAGRISLERLTI